MNIPMNQYPSIEQMSKQLHPGINRNIGSNKQPSGILFGEILKEQQTVESGELKFSKHANERLASRNIDLTDEQLVRLETGARRAGEKGIHESLVMVDNLAFIVNVKNNTVITAVNDSEDKVFTNIDGAVII